MKRNNLLAAFILTIISWGFLTCAFCVDAKTQNETIDEKLLNAVRDADVQSIKAALSGGADANAKDDDGLTALMHGSMYAGVDCVELLLANGADPNAKSKSEVTALMLAIGDAAKVKLLLAKGAEINAKSKQGHTALDIAAGRAGAAEVIKMLLDHGAKAPAINLLGAAASSGDIRVAHLLLERGADPNDKNVHGGPLVLTAKQVSERAKSALPQQKSPLIGLPGNIGGTPLMYAALAGDAGMLTLLIEKEVDVNARHNGNGTALMFAAQMGDLGAVKLLLEKGADPRLINEYGYTALMYASFAESNDPQLIKALLDRGAETNIRAKDNETALKLAGRKGRTEIVRLLKNAGAKE